MVRISLDFPISIISLCEELDRIWKQRFAEPFESPKNGHIHLDAGHTQFQQLPRSHERPQQHTPDL